jgi:hypothetical protein
MSRPQGNKARGRNDIQLMVGGERNVQEKVRLWCQVYFLNVLYFTSCNGTTFQLAVAK